MLKGGVIGFGGVGQELTRYFNNNCERAEIVAACNRGEKRLKIATDEFGLRGTHSVEELCSWDLDFVLVVSTNCAHKEQVLAAAKQGLHIFCEKPVAVNIADATEMVEAVEKAGVANVVNYSLRYQDKIDELKRFIEEGQLGEILSVSFERSRAYGLHVSGAYHRAIEEPEESGGWIVHHCCHQLDLLYYLFGEFATTYCQTKSTLTEKESEELVFANGLMKNGIMYHIGDSIAKIGYSHLVVTGTKASFASQSVGGHHFTRLREEDCDADNLMSFRQGWILGTSKNMRSVEHFLDCMEGKVEPVATLRSSLESLRVAMAMNESARTGTLIQMDSFGS